MGAYSGNAISRIRTETATSSTNVETKSSKDRAGSCANGDEMARSREWQAVRGPAEANLSVGLSCGGGAAEGIVRANGDEMARSREWQAVRGPAEANLSVGLSCGGGAAEGIVRAGFARHSGQK